jgi:hypothetical protein
MHFYTVCQDVGTVILVKRSFSLNDLFLPLFMYEHTHECLGAQTNVHTYGGQSRTLDVCLCCSLLITWRQSLPLNQKFPILTRLPTQWTLRICLSLPTPLRAGVTWTNMMLSLLWGWWWSDRRFSCLLSKHSSYSVVSSSFQWSIAWNQLAVLYGPIKYPFCPHLDIQCESAWLETGSVFMVAAAVICAEMTILVFIIEWLQTKRNGGCKTCSTYPSAFLAMLLSISDVFVFQQYLLLPACNSPSVLSSPEYWLSRAPWTWCTPPLC